MLPSISNRRFALPGFETASMRDEFDKLFDQFFGGLAQVDPWLGKAWHAPLSVWEDGGYVFAEVELPGVKPDEVEVTLTGNLLRVVAERKAPEGAGELRQNERRFGRIERLLTLPDVVNPNSIDAQLSHGVLRVKLAKLPEAQAKRIEVRSTE